MSRKKLHHLSLSHHHSVCSKEEEEETSSGQKKKTKKTKNLIYYDLLLRSIVMVFSGQAKDVEIDIPSGLNRVDEVPQCRKFHYRFEGNNK
jgi:hypothetical protein